MVRFWVGGYGADGDGDAAGIGFLAVDEGRGPSTLAYRGVAAEAPSPSWVAPHPSLDVVYAALEGAGEVQAFARSGEASLRPLGAPVAAGDGVCHLAVSPDGRGLVASCYGDGTVLRYGIGPDGVLTAGPVSPASVPASVSASVSADSGTDVGSPGHLSADTPGFLPTGGHPPGIRPELPPSRAHSAVFLPDGRIATADLGRDLIRIRRPDLAVDHDVALPAGTGPRHMVLHPSGHLHVVTEHSCEVFTLAAGRDGRWRVVAGTPTSPIARPGSDFGAELARSRDGATLYAGLRGSNTIAALRVRGSGEIVEPLALADAGVDWPRHHLVHDGAMLVAGQRSQEVGVLDLDERTGAPRGIRHRTPVPTPTCIVPAR